MLFLTTQLRRAIGWFFSANEGGTSNMEENYSLGGIMKSLIGFSFPLI